MRTRWGSFAAMAVALVIGLAGDARAADQVKTKNGIVEGTGPQRSGVRMFKGIPFAAPPIGELRWKPPQPVKDWEGVRPATQFGPRCMQQPVFGDMNFRSNGMSEDCLYLNVWTPAASAGDRLPVLVYFYGGGFRAGDGSEPRYDGESMARRGIVALTVNYRLAEFGFFAHPELTAESPQHASGNQGLLDQAAALQWVKQNIAAFGGDPAQVTIAGESAGSISVSALMASPVAKGLFARAIGESGAMFGPTLPAVSLADAERVGSQFATSQDVFSLAALRALTTQQIADAAKRNGGSFPLTIDGYFQTKLPSETFAAGNQSHVPLLAGSNSQEMGARQLMGGDPVTPDGFEQAVRRQFTTGADEVLKAYAPSKPEDVEQAATDLATDRFIAYSTWKWMDAHGRTGGSPVYYYYYSHPRPAMTAAMGNAVANLAGGVTTAPNNTNVSRQPPPRGAVHSAEIEYAMGNLETNKVFEWTPDDFTVSQKMQGYFANFIKTGNPNGSGLPEWQAANSGAVVKRMRLDIEPHLEIETRAKRYQALDTVYQK